MPPGGQRSCSVKRHARVSFPVDGLRPRAGAQQAALARDVEGFTCPLQAQSPPSSTLPVAPSLTTEGPCLRALLLSGFWMASANGKLQQKVKSRRRTWRSLFPHLLGTRVWQWLLSSAPGPQLLSCHPILQLSWAMLPQEPSPYPVVSSRRFHRSLLIPLTLTTTCATALDQPILFQDADRCKLLQPGGSCIAFWSVAGV